MAEASEKPSPITLASIKNLVDSPIEALNKAYGRA
jgi:hypothetical protein